MDGLSQRWEFTHNRGVSKFILGMLYATYLIAVFSVNYIGAATLQKKYCRALFAIYYF